MIYCVHGGFHGSILGSARDFHQAVQWVAARIKSEGMAAVRGHKGMLQREAFNPFLVEPGDTIESYRAVDPKSECSVWCAQYQWTYKIERIEWIDFWG